MLAELGVEYLIHDCLQQLPEVGLPTKQPLPGLRIERNLIVGHRCPLRRWMLEHNQPTREALPLPYQALLKVQKIPDSILSGQQDR